DRRRDEAVRALRRRSVGRRADRRGAARAAAQEARARRLMVVPAAGAPIAIALPDGTVVTRVGNAVIGRDPACDVVLASAEVSRRHAAIEVRGGDVYLTDNSSNGTLVGDRLVVRST